MGFGPGNDLLFVAPQYRVGDAVLMVGFSSPPSLLDVTDAAAVGEAVRAYFPGARVEAVDAHRPGRRSVLWRGGWLTYRPGQGDAPMSAVQQPDARVCFAGADIANGWIGWIDGALDQGAAPPGGRWASQTGTTEAADGLGFRRDRRGRPRRASAPHATSGTPGTRCSCSKRATASVAGPGRARSPAARRSSRWVHLGGARGAPPRRPRDRPVRPRARRQPRRPGLGAGTSAASSSGPPRSRATTSTRSSASCSRSSGRRTVSIRIGLAHEQDLADLDVSVETFLDRLDTPRAVREFIYMWAGLGSGALPLRRVVHVDLAGLGDRK